MLATIMDSSPKGGDHLRSLFDVTGTGFEIVSLTTDGEALFVRLFNAEGDNNLKVLSFEGVVKRLEMVELNGKKLNDLQVKLTRRTTSAFTISIPRFGIRTIKLTGLTAAS